MRISLVTGAGSGIGRAVALKLLALGDHVVLVGRHEETLTETQQLSGEHAKRAQVAAVDITEENAVATLFQQIESTHGRIDFLFNNAGISHPTTDPDKLTVEAWRDILDINLTGTFLCTKFAFDLMRRQQPQGGRIINNGSVSAHVPRPGSAGYTASKHALTGLTKSIALDGRPFMIACGQIDIGNARTTFIAAMEKGVRQANGSLAREPTIDVKHIADAVVFMASLPLDANIQQLTLLATQMPFVGRG